ncbi:MAG: hypothetical protein WC829_23280, partial [Hyphomicrobium sp.]
FAEFERGRIVERITTGIYLKRKKGGYTGGRNIPYGMKVVGHGADAKFEPDPVQHQVFALIRERMSVRPADFFSPRLLAKELTEKGIFNRRGNPFKSNHIARMAKLVRAQDAEQSAG